MGVSITINDLENNVGAYVGDGQGAHPPVNIDKAAIVFEADDGSGNGTGKIRSASAHADGPDGRRRHGVLQENAHLVFEHFFFFVRGDAILKQDKKRVAK